MELQMIEPLLMDYALGATTPEVSALIEAYLAKDAEARARLEPWREVAGLARRAIPAQEMVTVPVFPLRQLQTAQRNARWRRAAVWGAALAACLAVGYFAGSQGYFAGGLGHEQSNTTAALGGASPATSVAKAPAAADAPGAVVPIAAVENFGSPAWWRAIAQRNAERPVRSPSNSFNNLSVLFHQFGG